MRIAIAGVPNAGKTTHARKIGTAIGNVLHTDELRVTAIAGPHARGYETAPKWCTMGEQGHQMVAETTGKQPKQGLAR